MISVLIPVYNTEKNFLLQCVNSTLKQSFKSFEIIIVDNQSDNKETLETLEKFKKHEKIKIFTCSREKNKKNLSIALNFGLKNCKYDYVARMDSDDIMFEKRLETQYNYMLTNTEVDVVGCQLKYLGSDRVTNHPKIINKKFAVQNDWFINHPTVMFKKNKILDIGGYKDYPEFFPEDYELWLNCLTNNYIIHNIQDVLLFYRIHESNLTFLTQNKKEYFENIQKIKQEFINKNDIK